MLVGVALLDGTTDEALRLHQRDHGLLVQRVERQQLACQRGALVRRVLELRQAHARQFLPPIREPRALARQPIGPCRVRVVVESVQQLSAPQAQRVDEPAFARRRLELVDITTNCEADAVALRLDRPGPGQRARKMQCLAQVGLRELAPMGGPQQLGKVGPLDPLAAQREVGQQAMVPFGTQHADAVAMRHVRSSEQPQPDRG